MGAIKVIHRNIDERISNLTTQLIVEHPFFGMFLSSTNIFKEKSIKTAATDGLHIFYNPDFLAQLEDEEIKGVLLHEVLHMVYSHCLKKRRGIRQQKKWNIAADFAINWEIDEMDKKNIKLPHKIEIDGKPFEIYLDPKYKNMYVEQIYDLLPDEICNGGDGFDVHIDMPEDEDKQQELEDRIIASYEISKQEKEGKMPAGILRAIEAIRKSRVPWTRVFHRYVGTALAREDYSYSQPNRRFIGEDLYLPSLLSQKLGTIAIAVDTSGSVGQNELTAMAGELKKISALVSEVIVMSCDAKVHSFEVIRDMSNFQKAVKAIKGGGGTDFRPPFEMLKQKRIIPEIMIYMTDGHGTFPVKKDVKYPTIWLMTTEVKGPFGMTIQMRL